MMICIMETTTIGPNVYLLQSRFLIKEIEQSHSEGRLHVPNTSDKILGRALITRCPVGHAVLSDGMEVIFDKRQALPIKLEGQDFFIVHETMIYIAFTQ